MLEIDWGNVLDMSFFLLLCGVTTIVVVFLMVCAASGSYGMWLFSTDGNPYRRYCRKCGQQQNAYGRTYNKSQWWEDMGPTPDEDCICHTYSTYHA
jgi:hypothetical protein